MIHFPDCFTIFYFFLPVYIKRGTIRMTLMYGRYYGVNLSIYEYENMSECGYEEWRYCEYEMHIKQQTLNGTWLI